MEFRQLILIYQSNDSGEFKLTNFPGYRVSASTSLSNIVDSKLPPTSLMVALTSDLTNNPAFKGYHFETYSPQGENMSAVLIIKANSAPHFSCSSDIEQKDLQTIPFRPKDPHKSSSSD
ncbi:hypothetical protein N7456_010475 [Penicillium angulare]|uniref:Uncharacterized protein n=1 Tax=Penicillium angulare TaxID=116970 RepID=A0A9W9F6R2_9EURO|nr:hypothetical protein N7456_010475 [Penicillium angulare]